MEDTSQTEVDGCQYSTTLPDDVVRGRHLVQVTGATRSPYFELADLVPGWFTFAQYYDYDTDRCVEGKELFCKVFKVVSFIFFSFLLPCT